MWTPQVKMFYLSFFIERPKHSQFKDLCIQSQKYFQYCIRRREFLTSALPKFWIMEVIVSWGREGAKMIPYYDERDLKQRNGKKETQQVGKLENCSLVTLAET